MAVPFARALTTLLVVLIALTVWRFGTSTSLRGLLRPKEMPVPAPLPRKGAELVLEGFRPVRRSVVLALDSSCPICQRSVPLYREIRSRISEKGDWELFILRDNRDKSFSAWLVQNDLSAGHVLSLDFSAIGVWGTPTLFLISETGRVLDLRVGGLGARAEKRLWQLLDGMPAEPLDNTYHPEWVTEADLQAFHAGTQVVDTHPPGMLRLRPMAGALKVPLDELSARAHLKLSRTSPVALDCRQQPIGVCEFAAVILHDLGFEPVKVVVAANAR